jgi:glycine/D-amino acid oxidase-like deaminating enzyme/nitrite reductase/ring-hydroxylating ferredoxin subunit
MYGPFPLAMTLSFDLSIPSPAVNRRRLNFQAMPNYTNSVWSEGVPAPPQPPLPGNVTVDVAIVGGGITGITAALLLQQAGRRVTVVEARRIGKGETGKTTAHLTEALDTRYQTLVSRFGWAGAQLAAAAQRAAIERIARLVGELQIPCDLRRLPGFLCAENREQAAELEEEAKVVRRLGLDAALVDDVPLPFPVTLALRFSNQATFHPRVYLQALADAFVAGGGQIYEETQVAGIEEGEPCRVITDRGTVHASEVIVAAGVPIANRILLHAKLAAYRSYVVGVEVPATSELAGLFWDMAEPYHYIRSHRLGDRSYLLVGGEDHKVGEAEDTTAPFDRLETYVRNRFGLSVAATDFRWAGQIIESADGLPYIGRNSLSSRIFVASGYSGNGITHGTLAAMLLTDLICGRKSPLAELLDATRIKPLASAKSFLSENIDYPKHLLGDLLPLPGVESLARIPSGEGQVLSLGGQRLAVYRNGNGELSALSPVCTHLGCLVHWNTTEKSWDCPCHGSRFDPHGRVLNGPAVAALQARPLPGPDELEHPAEERPDRGAGEGGPVVVHGVDTPVHR